MNKWPRIKDLPQEEQAKFREFLVGQTCPLIEELPLGAEQQDAYYPWDYENFKRKQKKKTDSLTK